MFEWYLKLFHFKNFAKASLTWALGWSVVMVIVWDLQPLIGSVLTASIGHTLGFFLFVFLTHVNCVGFSPVDYPTGVGIGLGLSVGLPWVLRSVPAVMSRIWEVVLANPDMSQAAAYWAIALPISVVALAVLKRR